MLNACHVPAPPLNSYVKCFWYSDGAAPYTREKLLPTSEVGLTFNFGAPSRVSEPNRREQFTDCTESWLGGLRSGYIFLEVPAHIHMMSVDFKPGGAFPFLRFPLSEIGNQTISLDAIWGRFAAKIRERLYAAPSVQARFALLERLLRTRLSETPHGLDRVQFASDEIARCHGTLSMRALSERMGMSQKHLIAQFKRMVGTTPKALARLYRFRHVLRNIDPLKPVDWSRIVHQSQYYDQSHCYKDFQAFTGHSPGEYLRLRRQAYAENLEHARHLKHLPTG